MEFKIVVEGDSENTKLKDGEIKEIKSKITEELLSKGIEDFDIKVYS